MRTSHIVSFGQTSSTHGGILEPRPHEVNLTPIRGFEEVKGKRFLVMELEESICTTLHPEKRSSTAAIV